MSTLAALIWVALCSAAGMTPTALHRPIAYTLMAVFPVIGWFLVEEAGIWALFLYFVVAVFQLRLLLMSWARTIWARAGAKNTNDE